MTKRLIRYKDEGYCIEERILTIALLTGRY